jgi:hypothetical protein
VTSGQSSGRLGAISGELDGREHERGSPAAAGGVSRARERARVCKMRQGASVGHWQGSKKGIGRVGGRRGWETRRRARVCTRWSTAGARKAELTGLAHGAERVKGTRGATARRLANRARETEREGERAGEVTGADRVGSTGQRAREGGRARAGTTADRRGPPVRRRGRAAWLG